MTPQVVRFSFLFSLVIFPLDRVASRTAYIWVRVKMKPPGDRRFLSLVPFTRVPFWLRIFEPSPYPRWFLGDGKKPPQERRRQELPLLEDLRQRLRGLLDALARLREAGSRMGMGRGGFRSIGGDLLFVSVVTFSW